MTVLKALKDQAGGWPAYLAVLMVPISEANWRTVLKMQTGLPTGTKERDGLTEEDCFTTGYDEQADILLSWRSKNMKWSCVNVTVLSPQPSH